MSAGGTNRPSWIPTKKMMEAVRNGKQKFAILLQWDMSAYDC